MGDGVREALNTVMKRYGHYIAIVILAVAFVFFPDVSIFGGGNIYVDMGFDDQGKYLLVVPPEGTTLESLKLNGETVATDRWLPATGLKVRYPWSSGKTYRVEAETDSEELRERLTAPEVERRLGVESSLPYENGTLVKLHAVGHGKVEVYPASPPERVYILEYPLVSVTEEAYNTYISELTDYLKMADVDYKYVHRAEGMKRNGTVVVATGALPANETFVEMLRGEERRTVYIGVMPGSVVVDREGNVDTGDVFRGLSSSGAGVESEVLKMTESAYTSSVKDSVLARREDGGAAVFTRGRMTVFTNTVDGGWSDPEDAAWDTFMALSSSGGTMTGPTKMFSPGGDVLNTFLEVPESLGKLLLVARSGGGEVESIKVADMPESGSPLRASAVLLGEPLPGEREMVVEVVAEDSAVGGEARAIATGLDTGASKVTDLGKLEEGKNTFRKKVALPPGEVVLAVDAGGRLSEPTTLEIKEVTAVAEPVEGGYMVDVSEGGEPYRGTLTVKTPEKGRGELEINGSLKVTGESFKLYVAGHRIPVTYAAPDSGMDIPLTPIVVALVAALAAAPFLLARRDSGDRVRIVFEIPRVRSEDRVTASKVIEAFSKYNKFQGVKYFPLSVDELKHALNLFVTSGVSPTTRVIGELMDKMGRLSGNLKVKGYHGYYAPAYWEKEINQSIEHLAMTRAVYEHAVSKGYYARQLADKGFEPQAEPDLVLTDREKIVYVEVLSSVRKRSLEKDVTKYAKWLRNLRKVDKKRGYGYHSEMWVVLPAEHYRACRDALRKGEWRDGALIEALEKEGRLRIMEFVPSSESGQDSAGLQ